MAECWEGKDKAYYPWQTRVPPSLPKEPVVFDEDPDYAKWARDFYTANAPQTAPAEDEEPYILTAEALIMDGLYSPRNALPANPYELVPPQNWEREGFLRKFLSFSGRLDAITFVSRFYGILLVGMPIIAFVMFTLAGLGAEMKKTGMPPGKGYAVTVLTAIIVTLLFLSISYLALATRRLHDMNRSGILAFIPVACVAFITVVMYMVFPEYKNVADLMKHPLFVPLAGAHIGLYVFHLYLVFKKGTYGDNRYGLDPVLLRSYTYMERWRHLQPGNLQINKREPWYVKYLSMGGRLDRSTFLMRMAALSAMVTITKPIPVLSVIIAALAIYVTFSLAVRRLHDRNMTGLLLLILVIPAAVLLAYINDLDTGGYMVAMLLFIYGYALILILTFGGGDNGPNRFGNDKRYIRSMQYAEYPEAVPPLYRL